MTKKVLQDFAGNYICADASKWLYRVTKYTTQSMLAANSPCLALVRNVAIYNLSRSKEDGKAE
jgi:hypothetical protein